MNLQGNNNRLIGTLLAVRDQIRKALLIGIKNISNPKFDMARAL